MVGPFSASFSLLLGLGLSLSLPLIAAQPPLKSPIANTSIAPVQRSDGEVYAVSTLEPQTSRFVGEFVGRIENCAPSCCARRCLVNEDCLSFTVDNEGTCYLVSVLAPCATFARNFTAALIFPTAFDTFSAPPLQGYLIPAILANPQTSWVCRNYRGRVQGGSNCLADCVQAGCSQCQYSLSPSQPALGPSGPGANRSRPSADNPNALYDCACFTVPQKTLQATPDPHGVFLWLNQAPLLPATAPPAPSPELQQLVPTPEMEVVVPVTPSPAGEVLPLPPSPAPELEAPAPLPVPLPRVPPTPTASPVPEIVQGPAPEREGQPAPEAVIPLPPVLELVPSPELESPQPAVEQAPVPPAFVEIPSPAVTITPAPLLPPPVTVVLVPAQEPVPSGGFTRPGEFGRGPNSESESVNAQTGVPGAAGGSSVNSAPVVVSSAPPLLTNGGITGAGTGTGYGGPPTSPNAHSVQVGSSTVPPTSPNASAEVIALSQRDLEHPPPLLSVTPLPRILSSRTRERAAPEPEYQP